MKIEVDEFMLKLNKKFFKRELRLIAQEVKKKTIALLKQSKEKSKPGEAPAFKTGLLSSSITYKVKGNKVIIKDGAYYALFLESGAKNTGKYHKGTILPRPFLSTILEEMKDEIQERLTKAILEGVTTK